MHPNFKPVKDEFGAEVALELIKRYKFTPEELDKLRISFHNFPSLTEGGKCNTARNIYTNIIDCITIKVNKGIIGDLEEEVKGCKNKLLFILCHELQHARQGFHNRLTRHPKIDGILYWDGAEYKFDVDEIEKNGANDEYRSLPWEKDANEVGLRISNALVDAGYAQEHNDDDYRKEFFKVMDSIMADVLKNKERAAA